MEELPTKENVVAFLINEFDNVQILDFLQSSGIPHWITELDDRDRYLLSRNPNVIAAWKKARIEFEKWWEQGGE